MTKKGAKQKFYDFLSHYKVGSLSVLSLNNTPQASCVYYAVDKDLTVYFTCRSNSRKFASLSQHKTVAFCITDVKKMATLQMEGTVEQIVPLKKNGKPYKLLTKSFEAGLWNVPPFILMDGADIATFKINPTWVRYAEYRLNGQKTIEDFFEELHFYKNPK